MADDSLREDLMSNEELRGQSEELINILVDKLSDINIDDPNNNDFDPIVDILSAISISRARQGFSPRETAGAFSAKPESE